MSRKTKIYCAVIGALLLIIAGQKFIHFSSVPSVDGWKGDADKITIKNKNAPVINLVRKNGKWFVGDQNYPADIHTVTSLERKMNELSFTEFITDKTYYERFDLSENSAIRVTVSVKGKVVRDLLIGKASAAVDQSYVKYPDKPEVYLAGGSLASDFNKTVDALRDKTILSCAVDTIESVTVIAKGERFTIVREGGKVPQKNEAQKVMEDDKPSSSAASVKWVIEGRTVQLDSERVNEFIYEFASIVASAYPEESDIRGRVSSPQSEIRVKINGREVSLAIFGKISNDKGGAYLARSSEIPYYAYIGAWKVDRLTKRSVDLIKR
jgi:hypothetical protein